MRIPEVKPKNTRKDRWVLLQDWPFVHDDIRRTIPEGFIFDLASIPRWARSFAQKSDRRNWGPSLEHDFRYHYRIGPRKNADLAFRQRLVENGVSKFKAYLMYLAVRVGGSSAWRD